MLTTEQNLSAHSQQKASPKNPSRARSVATTDRTPFDIRSHLDKLTPAKGKNRYICPVCEGNNITPLRTNLCSTRSRGLLKTCNSPINSAVFAPQLNKEAL